MNIIIKTCLIFIYILNNLPFFTQVRRTTTLFGGLACNSDSVTDDGAMNSNNSRNRGKAATICCMLYVWTVGEYDIL